MTIHTTPIVGAFHRPPAQGILQALSGGQALRIVPEPENPYDSNALAVFVLTEALEPGLDDDLDASCQGYGYTANDIRGQEAWHLGYVPAKTAAPLAKEVLAHYKGNLGDTSVTIEGILTFDAKGKPCVQFSLA